MPKIILKVPLGQLTFNQKRKLKTSQKGKTGTKERRVSLGSWISFWEANMMWNLIAEYELLMYSKGSYLNIKLQIFIKMLAKIW